MRFLSGRDDPYDDDVYVEDEEYKEFRRYQRMAMAGRSFTGPAVLTLVLYFVLWIPGLVANVIYWREAREVERITGQAPPGLGCLSAMLVIVGVLGSLLICVFCSAGSHLFRR